MSHSAVAPAPQNTEDKFGGAKPSLQHEALRCQHGISQRNEPSHQAPRYIPATPTIQKWWIPAAKVKQKVLLLQLWRVEESHENCDNGAAVSLWRGNTVKICSSNMPKSVALINNIYPRYLSTIFIPTSQIQQTHCLYHCRSPPHHQKKMTGWEGGKIKVQFGDK